MSLIVGITSTSLEITISYSLKLAGLIKTPLYLFVGKLAVGQIPHTPLLESIIGITGHLINGTVFTFIFINIVQKWGEDYIYLKGLGFGAFLWIIHQIVIPNMIVTRIALKLQASSQIFHIIDNALWGIYTAFIYVMVKKLTAKRIPRH